ncbi:hypothetical protein BU23DRAFT_570957 [Bimuria novae-zelandiae CBS 107.79]|uniref:Uncharacterized protein n=1 Tax=Bimuria novae-zelandiae CBS 107.79 TaxID=1447943 RepID=A0A6A5UZH8_9PLEO|nr:hypothetical protein BU23DRAFT_570957 [Bimuria novae-zelandiae CBS 107.79]
MPPKRKIKATKPPAIASLKVPPAKADRSPKRRNSAGFPGPKMSRLHSSEPLHMKTRRAVKTASNRDSSGAPSTASSDSRRSSLNDTSRFEDGHSEIEDERPTKRNRLSPDSGTDSFADQIDIAGNEPHSSMSDQRNAIHGSKASPKKRRASNGSSESSESRANGVRTRTQSDTSERQQPRRKKRRTTTQPPIEVDQPPELTDASTAPNSPEQIPDVDSSQNLHHVLPTNGDAPAKMGRRLPGRRRAPHPDINVEVDLRRQLNLKMSYRSLAKVQKNILEELSSRTTALLDNDPQFHKQCPEYEPLMASLDQYKETRVTQIEALRREKLAQLERVIAAEEHIANEKYVQRFYDLQEDLLLQCFYRAKQLQRESRKNQDAAGTEDEDNILPLARFAFPPLHADDRVGSKHASRSRAYIETERLLNNELRRVLFGRSLTHFITEDEDADDSILETPNAAGFATFTGPDRTDAIAHQNIKDLIEAANDIENAPIADEATNALHVLAHLSAEVPRITVPKNIHPLKSNGSAAVNGPQVPPRGLGRVPSPARAPSESSVTIFNPTQTEPEHAQRTNTQVQDLALQQQPSYVMNGIHPVKEKAVPPKELPARSTHRIMDMLNNDSDMPMPLSTSRLPPTTSVDQTHSATPSRSGRLGLSSIIHQYDVQSDRSALATRAEPIPSREAYSSPAPGPAWPEVPPKPTSHIRPMSYEELRRRDPLHMLRDMLNAKNKTDGKPAPIQRSGVSVSASQERAQMTAPSLSSRPPSPLNTSEKIGQTKESRRPSNSYNASPSTAPLSYQQSPSAAHTYLPRQGSQDPGSSHWERDRRLSGSKVPQPPTPQTYTGSPRQSQTAPHQSLFSTTTGQASASTQLPSISQSLSLKPSGSQSNAPINFRFAHYDPAPPRSAYQPSQASYPPSSSVPSHALAPPHYSPSYSGPSYQGGYIPPPGSFQAPPPPPTTTTNASTPYPALKIHQYGGQPILPANMAPSPSHSQPPNMNFIGQAPPPLAYSPPQHQAVPQRNPSHDANDPREPSFERSAEPGSGPVRQPRRPYRSYHAPGSQFRAYNGPHDTRRRGG